MFKKEAGFFKTTIFEGASLRMRGGFARSYMYNVLGHVWTKFKNKSELRHPKITSYQRIYIKIRKKKNFKHHE